MKGKKLLCLLAAAGFVLRTGTGVLAAEEKNPSDSVSRTQIQALQDYLLTGKVQTGAKLPDPDGNGRIHAADLTLAKRAYLAAGADTVELTNLRADIGDILLNTEETVTFTVRADRTGLPEKTVALFDGGKKPAAYMHDDGKNGDKTADDGIYSAQLKMYSDDFRNVDYYAAAGDSKSKLFRICFYRELTVEELKGFAELQEKINAFGTFEEASKFVSGSDEIKSSCMSDEKTSILYESVYHISGFWTPPGEPGTRGRGEYAIPDEAYMDFSSLNKAIQSLDFTPAHPDNRDVILLSPAEHNQNIRLYGGIYAETARLTGEALDGDVSVVYDANVSIAQMKCLSGYGTVIINTHGCLVDGFEQYGEKVRKCKHPYIMTGVPFNTSVIVTGSPATLEYQELSADLASSRVTGGPNQLLCVGTPFFDYYYPEGSLKDSIWHLAACSTLTAPSLADTLISKGAGAVTGFSAVVNSYYSDPVTVELLLNSLILSADSISGSVEECIRIHGSDPKGTKLCLRGDPGFRLVESMDPKEPQPEDNDGMLEPTYPYDPDPDLDSELHFKLYTDTDGAEKYMVYGGRGVIDAVIPSSYEGKEVNRIADGGFSGCQYLKTVSIPGSITVIPESAFQNCQYLQEIHFPRMIREIGDYAFWDCRSITEIHMPRFVKTIGSGAFGLTSIESFDFYSLYQFDDLSNLFSGCTRLKRVHLYAPIEKLSATFYGCTNLEEIRYPDDLKTIGVSAFTGCDSLKEIVVPDGVETLEPFAINKCGGIETLVLPQSLRELGQDAVSECPNLKKAVLPPVLNEIGSNAFMNCVNLREVQMPFQLYTIHSSAFRNCYELRSIELPHTLTTVGNRAFSGCSQLCFQELPLGIAEIEAEAFAYCRFNCQKLYYSLPSELRKLDLTAFWECGLYRFDIISENTEITEPSTAEENMLRAMLPDLTLRGLEGSKAQEFVNDPAHPCKFVVCTLKELAENQRGETPAGSP